MKNFGKHQPNFHYVLDVKANAKCTGQAFL